MSRDNITDVSKQCKDMEEQIGGEYYPQCIVGQLTARSVHKLHTVYDR